MKNIHQLKVIGMALFFIFFLSPTQTFAHKPEKILEDGDNLFQQYSWIEIINPVVLLSLLVIYIAYLFVIKRRTNLKISFLKKVSFFFGLFTTYIALAGPISILANNSIFSAHMLQQSLMYVVMPPLILVGLPEVFYHFVDKKLSKPVLRLLKSPLIGLLLFNSLWSFYHIPTFYENISHNLALLQLTHVVITSSAFLMWIQVLAPEGVISNLSPLKKIGYMFLNGMLITPACALIIFSQDVLYSSMFQAPILFSWQSPLDDQQLGGIIMKIVQEFAYGSVIGYIFYKWAKGERAKDSKIDPRPASVIE
ncbi:cytochrome c oxidase assembly protein [Aquibacillus sp. 3ASR75-11]|uniref:Cytochrome c oxidase assembly protein n=3 Tax=Terrihalobacillus insolitus TaxID=2950438 RepID=A0A9X3WQR6_9BACI|nr:cytochrome c oxidase assembly protein [Terrihalobacillus insolitus]MDC3412319.1 cytochrome c oxidase assembly protein [Terrihalobacillus insolitus]MDC3422988.1 cytochrome c oxidase assembly protein [Terrihalobacillus insolitus]